MLRSHLMKPPVALLMGPLLGGMMLASCSAAPNGSSVSESGAAAPDSLVAEAEAPADAAKQDLGGGSTNTAPRQQPQLIKTAKIVLQVEKVDDAVKSVSQVVREQQG